MSSELKVLQVIPNLDMGVQKQVVMILHTIYQKIIARSYIVTSGGELLKFIDKKKVKLIKLPVHSKNPLLIIFNSIALDFYYFS